MSQDVVCRKVGGWERRKIAQVLQLERAFGSTALSPPVCPMCLSPSVRLHVLERAGDSSGESDPEMSTLLLVAAHGNQVSCLIKALSDELFIPSRDSKAPRLYSRSHAHLKKTIWNITIWCRD